MRKVIHPYDRFKPEDLILRDELALDRTVLANERTLLSYLRSGVALIVAGGTIVHFSETMWYFATGIACIPLGAAVSAVGISRFVRMHRSIKRLRARKPNRRTVAPH